MSEQDPKVDHAVVPFECGCRFYIPTTGEPWRSAKRELEVECKEHGRRVKGLWAQRVLLILSSAPYLAEKAPEGPKNVGYVAKGGDVE
jgi:hypothetical protein